MIAKGRALGYDENEHVNTIGQVIRLRVKIINNPNSGMKKIQKDMEVVIGRLVLENVLRTVDKVDTTIDFDYDAALSDADTYDMVFSVGGDGTLHKVVNSMARLGINTPLMIIPAGTVNDFATILGIPQDIDGLCKIIRDHMIEAADLCKCNDDFFINVAGAGLLTEVAHKTPDDVKSAFGRLAYYAHGLYEVPKQFFKSLMFEFEFGGEKIQKDCFLFLVMNSRSAGGFDQLAPHAEINDGKFDVCIIERTDLFQSADVFFRILSGDHINSNNVEYFQTDHLKITCVNDESVNFDLDGEYGGVFPMSIDIVPAKINLVMPQAEPVEPSPEINEHWLFKNFLQQ